MERYLEILRERFGRDSLLALATVDAQGKPWSRTIDALFVEDSFYTITYAKSKKMAHIAAHPLVAVSGEWFSGHAEAANLGHVQAPENAEIAQKLRQAFAAWYDNGHTNEDDPHTIILRLRVTDGILFDHGTRIEF